MGPLVEIDVLGDMTVRCDGHEARLPPSRKTRALLAFLAVTQRPARRERLCEMFWDVPDDPKGALRWSLSKLRQILNRDGRPCLEADRNTAALTPGTLALDYDLIRDVPPGSVGELPTDRLEAIAAVFRGPFLADLHLPRCPEFEAWRTSYANETEILRLKVLRALVDRLHDDPERALAYAHALQALLPEESLGGEIARINDRARLVAVAETVAPLRPSPSPPPPVVAPAAADVGEAAARDEAPAETVPRSKERQQELRFCRARDGVRIAYAASGDGPAIVRAAHWMSHLEFDWESPVWRHWMDALSGRYTLVRYDERLNGLSDAVAEDISFEALVADLESVIDANRLDRFILLGISQGCAISVEYAVRHPHRVAGLVLYGGYVRGWRARGDPAEIAKREAMTVLMREGWGQDDPTFRQLFTNLFIPGANREQMDWFNELQRRTITPQNAWRLANTLADIDISDRLDRVRVPTLVAHARDDRVVPFFAGIEFAKRIPTARFVELESSNHILLEDEPAFQRFLDEVHTFARQVAEAPPVTSMEGRARRQATVLAADFISPIQAFEDLDPELTLDVIDPLISKATDLIKACGGTVVAVSDSGLTASFGAPEPHEDHAAFACRAALSLRDLVRRDPDQHVRVRIALDTGVVIVGPGRAGALHAADVRGGPLTVARMLDQALRRDVIAATERTRTAAGGFVRMQPLEPLAVSGFSRDQRLFEVLEINHGPSRWWLRADRRLSRFVGRETPLTLLRSAWQQARDGEGQTIVIVGEPGLGKSRMTHEFVGAIPAAEAEILEAGALETDLRAGFLTVRKALHGLFGIDGTETKAVSVDKVLSARRERGFDERLLDPLLSVLELPAIDAGWAALPAPEQARRVREAVAALFLFLAEARPLALLIEDLHWIDAESEAILARLAETVSSGRILVILTCRPEYDRSVFSGAGATEIRLGALRSGETSAFLDDLLGDDPQLGRLRVMLAEACKGNPLFLEESVRALADTGRLTGEPGRYRAAGEIDEIVLSASIQSLVDARFESLGPDEAHVAEVASVLGGEIPGALLSRLSGLPGPRFDNAVQKLRTEDILIEAQVFPDASFRFKHALIRSAVYQRIVSAARVELHRAALAELETLYAGRIEENAERLARHAREARMGKEAATYLLMSAWKAIRRSAQDRALADIDLGLNLLRGPDGPEDADRREIEFQHARGIALMAAKGWSAPEVLKAFERAEQLCEAVGDRSRLFTTLRGRAQYYMISGKPAAAQELACRCAQLVDGTDDAGLRIETEHMFWTNGFFLGEVRSAREHAERAIALYEPDRDHPLTHLYSGHDPGVCSRCFSSLASWLAGDPDAARQRAREALDLAHRFDHPLTTALAYWGEAYRHILAADPEPALHWAERAVETAERFQLPLVISLGIFQLGWTRFMLGETDAGLERMEEGIAAIRRSGAEMGLPYFMALHAEATARAGGTERALRLIAAAHDLVGENGTRLQLSEILRIEAGIREAGGAGRAEIEALLLRADAVAVDQGAALGRLRVAVARAHLCRERGRDAEARELILPHAPLIERLGDAPDARAARELA